MKSEKTKTRDAIIDSLEGVEYDVYKTIEQFQSESVAFTEQGSGLQMSNGKIKLFCYDKSGKVQTVKEIKVAFFYKSDHSMVKDDERPNASSVELGYFISP